MVLREDWRSRVSVKSLPNTDAATLDADNRQQRNKEVELDDSDMDVPLAQKIRNTSARAAAPVKKFSFMPKNKFDALATTGDENMKDDSDDPEADEDEIQPNEPRRSNKRRSSAGSAELRDGARSDNRSGDEGESMSDIDWFQDEDFDDYIEEPTQGQQQARQAENSS